MVQATSNTVAATIHLNDYRLVVDGTRWSLTGPDSAVAEAAWKRLIVLSKRPEGQRLLTKSLRVEEGPELEAIEAQLIELLKIPPSQPTARQPATENQRSYARHVGLDAPDHICGAELARRLHDFHLVRTYMELVWCAMTQRKPQESGVNPQEINHLAVKLINNSEFLHRIHHARLLRIETPESQDWQRAAQGALSTQVRVKPADPLYQEVSSILRRQWGRYLAQGLVGKMRRMFSMA